jgi:hypothetical protein
MISDSASGISKGVRLRFGVAATRNNRNPAKPHGVKRCQA